MNLINYCSKKGLGKNKNDLLVTNIDFDLDSKKIFSFSVIQIHVHGEHNLEIIKYDSSHNYCHVHKYYENLNDFGQKLLDNQVNEKSFVEFKNDIKQNYQEYLKKYFRKWFREKL